MRTRGEDGNSYGVELQRIEKKRKG